MTVLKRLKEVFTALWGLNEATSKLWDWCEEGTCLVSGGEINNGCRPKAGPAISLTGLRRETTSLKIGQRTMIKGMRRDLSTSIESRKGALTSLRREQQNDWTFAKYVLGLG